MEVNITAQDENKVLSQSADIPDSNNSLSNEQQNVECANTSKNSDFASETIVSFLTPVSSPALLSPTKSVLTFSTESAKIQPESKSIETEKCDDEIEKIQKTEILVQNESSQANERNYNSPKKLDNKNIKFNYQVSRKKYGKNKRKSKVTNIPSLFDIKTVKPEFMSPQNNFPQLQRFDNQNFSPQYIAQSFTNYNLPQFNENPNFPLQFNELPAFAQNQSSPQGLMDQNPLNFNIQRFDDQNCPVPFNSLNEQNLLQLNISQFEVHNHPALAPFSSDQNIEFSAQLPPLFFDRQLPSTPLSSNKSEDDDQNHDHLSNIQLPADPTQTAKILKDVSVDKQDNLKTSSTSDTVKTEIKYSPEDTLLDKPMESEKYPEQKESPVATRPVLGREQAKKRLQAFSLMKFGLAKQDKNKKVVSPVKKVQLTVEEGYDENGEKIEVVSVKKPPKKGSCHLERAKAVISEIEELKKKEAVLTVIQAQAFSGLLPMQASKLIKSVKDDASKLDQKDHKKSKESDSYKMSSVEKSGSKEKHKYSSKSEDVKKPSSWNDVKEWGYDMAMIRKTKSKRSYRSDSESTKLEECLEALDGVVKMRNPLNVKTQNGNIKVYPQEIVKYTSKSPSISYSENPKNCHSFFPNRTRVLAVTPVSRAEICNKFISDSLSPKIFSDKPITSRNWFSQDFLMPMPNAEPKDEKLITKGYGLSVLTENYKNTNWDESDDEKEIEETVPIRTAEESNEQLQIEKNEPINQVVEKSDILEKPLKYKEDTVKIDRRTSDECDRRGTEKSDKMKYSDEKKDTKKNKEKQLEPIEKKEQHGSIALEDTLKTNVKKETEEKFDKQRDVKNNEYSKQSESIDPTSDRCRTPNTDEYRPDWELGEDILPPDIDANCLGIPKLNELSPRNWESDDEYFKAGRNIRKEVHLKDTIEDSVGKHRNMSNERKSKDINSENYSHKKDSKSREKTDEKDRYLGKKYSENNARSYDEVKDNSKSKNKSKDYIRSNQRYNISTDSEKEIKNDSKVKIDSRLRDTSRSRSRGDSRPKSRSDSRTREDLRPREKNDNYKRNRSRSIDEKKFEPNINERVRDDFIFNEKLYSETKISGDRNRNEMKWNEERLSPERYRENWDFSRRQDDDLQMYNRTKDDLRFRSNSKYDDLHSDFKSFNVETDKYREDRKFSEIFDHELNERRDYNQQYERGIKADEYNELFDRPSSIKEPHDYEVGQKYRGDEKGYRYSPQISNHNDDANYKSSHRNDWEEEDDIKPDYRKEEHWNDRRKWEEYQRSPYENFRENCWRDKNWEKEDDYRFSKDGRRLRWQEWQDEQINEFRMRERKLHSDERYPNESYFLDKDYLERNDDRLRRSLEREGYNKSRRSVEKQDTERRSLEREGYNKPRYPEKADSNRRSSEREGYNKPRYPEKADTTRKSPEREGYNKSRYPEKVDSIRRSLEREGYNKPRYPEKVDSIRRSVEREGYNKPRYPEKADTTRKSPEREGYNKPRYPEKTDITRRSLEREGYNKPRYPEKTDSNRRSSEREGYNKPRYPEKADTTRRSSEREGYYKPRYPEKADTTRRSSEREGYNKLRRLSEKQDIGKLKSTEKDNSNKRRKSFEEHNIDNSRIAEKENTNKKRLSEKHDVDKLKKSSDKEYYKPRESLEKQDIHKSRQSVEKEGSKSKRSSEKPSTDKSRRSVEREGYMKSKQDIDKSFEKESFYSNSKQDDKSLEKGNSKSKKSSEKETSQLKWSPERKDDKKLTEINISKKLPELKEGSRSGKNSDQEKNNDKIQKSIGKENSYKSKKSSEKGITVDKFEEALGEIDVHKSKRSTEKDFDKSKRRCIENDESETYKLLEDTDKKIKRSEKNSNERRKDITTENKTKSSDFKETFLLQSLTQPDKLLIRPISPDLKSNDKLASEYEEFIKTVGCESENDPTLNKEDNTDKNTKASTSASSGESSSEEVNKKSKKKTLSKRKSKSTSSYESSSESEEEVPKKHKKSTQARKKNEKAKNKKSKKVSSESSSGSSTSESSSSSTSSTDSSSDSSSSSSSSTSSSSSSSESEEASKSEEKLSVEKIKIKQEKLSDDERKSATGAGKKRKRKSSDSSDVSSSSTSSSSEDESEESDQADKAVTDNSEVIKPLVNANVNCEENLTLHELTKDNLTKAAEKSADKDEMEDFTPTGAVSKTKENDKLTTVFENIQGLQTIPTKIYQLSDYKQSMFEQPISFSSQSNKKSLQTADVDNDNGTPVISCDNAARNQKELLHSELANNSEADSFNTSRTLNSPFTDSLLHKRTHEDDNEIEDNQNKKICTDNLMSKNECENTENYPNNFNSDSTSQYLVKDKSDFESKHDEFRSSSRQKSESEYRRDYGRSGRPRDSLERSERSRNRGSKRDRYEYERSSKRSRHSRSRSRDRSRNRDHSKRGRSRERHRSKDRERSREHERSREDYDISRGYDRRRRSESQTKRDSHRIPKDVVNVDSIPLPERMWHGNSDLTYMNMELVKSPSSPLDGFKRSVADSTISDSELLRMQSESSYYNETDKRISSDLKKYKPTLPTSPVDSPIVSPRRISLDDRINQVLGIDKEETPKPIETVGSHEGTYSNYYDQYHGYAQQYDNYRMPMKSMVPPLPTNYYQGMQMCRETTAHGPQVLQVGNVLQVVPTELPPAVDKVQATVLPPQNVNKNASTTKVVQVGNMLQIVPTVITTEKKTKPKLSDLPLPPMHDASEESPQPTTEAEETVTEKGDTKPVQEDEVALRRKERAKRRADREQRRKEKESKRIEKEKRRELRIKLRTENMIKRALQLETRELSLNLDESEILEGTEDNEKNEKSGPTMWPPPMLAPVPLPQPPAKGILITSGFSKLKNKEDGNLDEDTSKKIVKKSVKFADGICPGEGTSPSGGEELPSPPPPTRKLPKEQRYKKTKLKTKKKVKVKIIRNDLQQAADEDDDEEDNLPPPPPPPGSPPPHLWPKQSRLNNINPTVGFAHPSTNQPYPPVLSNPAAFGIQAQMGPGPPGAYPPGGPMPSYPAGFPPVGPPPPSGPYPGYTFQPRPGYNAPGGNCIPRVNQPPGGVYHPPVYPVTGSPARPFGPPPPPMQAHPPVYGMAYNNLSSSKSHRKTM